MTRLLRRLTGLALALLALAAAACIEEQRYDHVGETVLLTPATPVAYVTEDTTRTPPRTLDRLFRHAINLGCRRLVLCDTVGHVTPEAQEGGPIALVKNGDQITIDAEANRIDLALTADELTKRKAAFKAPPYKFTRGTLYKYIKNVKSASDGCVTDE